MERKHTQKKIINLIPTTINTRVATILINAANMTPKTAIKLRRYPANPFYGAARMEPFAPAATHGIAW